MHRREFLRAVAGVGLTGVAGCSRRPTAAKPADLARLDAIAQAALVESGELSARELVEAGIERLQAVNAELNAVVTTAFESARASALRNNAAGSLFGVPTLLKDLNNYPGMRFTRGSRAFANAEGDAKSAYTKKIDATGLVILGKSNTPEFGLLPTTESLALGPARNPWNPAHSTGGSSGGSAAAVAARIVPIAQASDGGGSIRIPAAACGVFGLKPTRGRFPDQDTPSRGWPISIRHANSHSVRDNALMLGLTEASHGELSPVGYVAPEKLRPLKIALSVKNGFGQAPDPEVAAAVRATGELLQELGHEIIETEQTPLNDEQFFEQFLRLWAVSAVSVADAVAAMTGKAARETGLLEPWTLDLADYFRSIPQDPIPGVIRQCEKTERDVGEFFTRMDAWLTATVSDPAPKLGHLAPDLDYATLLERVTRFAAYTPIHNTAGTPAMSLPMAMSRGGLPIGVQISAAFGEEARLLQLAYQLEEARPWAEKLPPINATKN